MEIVIKISEKAYNALTHTEFDANLVVDEMRNSIVQGTVLPKGHGKLKDFDKIEWYGCDFEGRGCIEAKGDCSVCNHANCDAKQVRKLPTIIEADKESEE